MTMAVTPAALAGPPGRMVVHQTEGGRPRCGRPNVTEKITKVPAGARMCARCTDTRPAGHPSSIYFSAAIEARRSALKAATMLTDAHIYEHGLLKEESDLEAAIRRGEQNVDCPHPMRYPNGRCRYCYRAPAAVTVDTGGTRGRVNRTGRSVADETLRDAIRQMGPEVTVSKITGQLHIGAGRARRLLDEVKAEDGADATAVPAVTFMAGTP